MEDKEVLQKAIEVAIENGYRPTVCYDKLGAEGLDPVQVRGIILSRRFGIYFFGEGKHNMTPIEVVKEVREIGFEAHMERLKKDWQFHLQQMVLCPSPIDYLREFLSNAETPKNI